MFKNLILVALCAGFSSLSIAQTETTPTAAEGSQQPPLHSEVHAQTDVRFQGIVQYTEGLFQRLDGDSRTTLEFQAPLFEGETFALNSAALVKIKTRELHTLVIYGPAKIATPNGEKLWQVEGNALRVISGQSSIKFVYSNTSYELNSNSEILFDDQKFILLRGGLKAEGRAISAKPFEAWQSQGQQEQNKKWIALTPQPSEFDRWQFNNQWKSPKEGLVWKKPKQPTVPDTTADVEFVPNWKLIVSAGGGPAAFWHSNWHLHERSLESGGGILIAQKKNGESAKQYALRFYELNSNQKNFSNSMPSSGVYGRSKAFGFEYGIRKKATNWWSPFYRAGVYSLSHIVSFQLPDQNYYAYKTYNYIGVGVSGGVDMQLYTKKFPWLGFYARAEAHVDQSVIRTTEEVQNEYSNNGTEPAEAHLAHGWLTSAWVQLGAGLIAQW